MGSHSFELKTSDDFYRAFCTVADEFDAQPKSTVKAVTFAFFAWHLTDWILKDPETDIGRFRDEPHKFRGHVRKRCRDLCYMEEITNGTKHLKLGKEKPTVKRTEKLGAFSRAFSKGFDVSRLQLKLNDGSVVWFEDSVSEVRRFWRKYFRNDLKKEVTPKKTPIKKY